MKSTHNQFEEAKNRKRCVACHEYIHFHARTCPQCHTLQSPKKWKSIGEVLKWLGGIAALSTLIIGVVQLSEIFRTTQERTQAVDELVRAANVQISMDDYAGALQLIEQALALELSSRQARELQLQVAMKWIRQFTGFEHRIYSFKPDDYLRIIEPLVPLLHRGTADRDPSKAANVLAHIGWANHLRLLGGAEDLNPAEYFQLALDNDPSNVFAHAMWATMCTTNHKRPGCGDDYIETARKHYAAARKSGQELDYVNNIRLQALLDVNSVAGVQLVDLVNEIRRGDTTFSMENKYDVLSRITRLYIPMSGSFATRKEAETFKISDVLSAVEWLFERIEYEKVDRGGALCCLWDHRVLIARLNELTGNSEKAIRMYCSTRLDYKAGRVGGYGHSIKEAINENLLQMLNIRIGALDLRLDDIGEQLAQNLGLEDSMGAIVEEVKAGGGAEEAGIKVGDVILKVNDISYERRNMRDIFELSLAGDEVEVLILRDGQQQTLKVILRERDPSYKSDHLSVNYRDNEYLIDRTLYGAVHVKLGVEGVISLANLTDELRDAFEVDSGVEGIVTLQGLSNFRQGQVITKVDRSEVSTVETFVKLIKDAQLSGKQSILITLIHKDKRTTRALELFKKDDKAIIGHTKVKKVEKKPKTTRKAKVEEEHLSAQLEALNWEIKEIDILYQEKVMLGLKSHDISQNMAIFKEKERLMTKKSHLKKQKQILETKIESLERQASMEDSKGAETLD